MEKTVIVEKPCWSTNQRHQLLQNWKAELNKEGYATYFKKEEFLQYWKTHFER